jgi:chemotaxis protein MotB
MAKNFDAIDDVGKPGKPPKHRRFPWRLWLYALFMTAAAGAGGYFVYHFHSEAEAANDARTSAELKYTEQVGTSDKIRGENELTKRDKDAASKLAADCKVAAELQAKGAQQVQQQNDALMKNLNASKDELVALRTQKAENDKRLAAIEDIQRQFAKMIDTGALKVSARRGMLVLSLPAEVLFPSGVAELSKDGEMKVLEVGITLKKFQDRRFMVIGHSDNQPLQKASIYKDNWELSTARALTVSRFLAQAGMNANNIMPSGAGDHDPIFPNNSAANMARNRRIEIALLPAINELPPMPASLSKDGK